MFLGQKGISGVLIILLVALFLVGGVGVGYAFREPIKKTLQGKTSADEIKDAVNDKINELKLGQSKFELEGVIISISENDKTINVKIKSSSDSIKEFNGAETPISVSDSTEINFNDKKDLKIADIPINSKVHVGGTIADDKLVANKIIIQKEDADEKEQSKKRDFSIGGKVQEISSDSLKILIKTANSKVKDKKGKELIIKVTSATIIEKEDSKIVLSEINVDDEVHIIGVVLNNEYIASKIEVKAIEVDNDNDAEGQDNNSSNNNQNNKNKNQGNSNNNKNNDDEED